MGVPVSALFGSTPEARSRAAICRPAREAIPFVIGAQ